MKIVRFFLFFFPFVFVVREIVSDVPVYWRSVSKRMVSLMVLIVSYFELMIIFLSWNF